MNSLHHQAVERPADALHRTGWDLDKITQAIEPTDNAPIIGVQWHPEYMIYLRSQFRIFRWLVDRACS